ncbi:hypothetical protein [Streptomyces sasae]|uniref:hypothetical protein n=1 Tax=Streptomyces sasae TaxID=1266772 RepID=UPI00292CE127|nr:hypothetical protein [Streptomyces sasae]
MTPRHSRPEDAKQELEAAVTAAKQERDDAVTEADRKFWTRIHELKSLYRGAQTDIAELLGVTRDAVLKATKKHAGTADK